MSRGLGKIEREILTTLNKTEEADHFSYRGKGYSYNPGWVFYNGYNVKLADDVYDLRAILKYMAIKNEKTYCRNSYVEGSFQASFSRAVKNLIKRKMLLKLSLIPITDVDLKEREKEGLDYGFIPGVMLLADGLYIDSRKQTRFVKKNI
jgi:hypothetical protein